MICETKDILSGAAGATDFPSGSKSSTSTDSHQIFSGRHGEPHFNPLVLLVSHLQQPLNAMAATLRKAGYRVVTAGDGLTAFDAALEQHPQLIICDVSTRHLDGVTLCRRIKTHRTLGSIPILLVNSISKDSVQITEDSQLVADDYLEAPYDPLYLVARTAYLIGTGARDRNRFADDGEQPICPTCGRRNMTEHQLAEETLRQREAQLAEAQRLAHIGSFEWDPVTGNSAWSDELYRILGLAPQSRTASLELVAGLIPSEQYQLLQKLFNKAVAENEPFECETRLLRTNGAARVVQVKGQKILSGDSNRVTVIGTVQDITETKAAAAALRKSEAQLLQSQKMEAIGRLAGGIAHDFNNLLTVICGYSELALLGLDERSSLYQKILEIRNTGDRAATLTRQLLAFSRRQVLQPQVINLNRAVDETANMLRRVIGEHISFKTVLDSKLGSIKVDPGQIEQVLLNLAVNARDAMPDGGKLTIETRNTRLDDNMGSGFAVVPGHYVEVAVSDTGCGMDKATSSRVFEPFFTTKPTGQGTGLGLATVYGIVKQSGGYIWVYSEVNHGTCFKLYFPRLDLKADLPRPNPVTAIEELRGTETILLVEDEEGLRLLMRRMLESTGYKVLDADGGPAALALCEQHQGAIDLMLTDVVMPGMSGRAVTSRCRRIRPEMKVLYMSGYTDDTIVHHGVLDPGINFLPKPLTLQSLGKKVREVLNHCSD